jgi:hypothetical protein
MITSILAQELQFATIAELASHDFAREGTGIGVGLPIMDGCLASQDGREANG